MLSWVSAVLDNLFSTCLRTIAKFKKQSDTVVHDNALFRYISTYGLMTLTFSMNRGSQDTKHSVLFKATFL